MVGVFADSAAMRSAARGVVARRAISTRSSAPLQRRHETRGAEAETDITIPREHSRTGIACLRTLQVEDTASVRNGLTATYNHLCLRQNGTQRNGEERG